MKSAIFFIVGAALGAIGGVFVTKYVCEAKTEQKIAEATIEAREYYKEKYNKEAKENDESTYKKLASTYTTNPVDDRIFGSTFALTDTVNYREHPVDEQGNKSYIREVDPDKEGIDLDYTSYSLDYYQNGVLVDEDDNLIDDPTEIAGDYLAKLSLENPEIFICNDVTKTVYDICYIAACYEQPGGMYD